MILGNQFNFYLAVLYEIERVLQCWSGVSLAQVSVIVDLFSAAAAPSVVTIVGTRTRADINNGHTRKAECWNAGNFAPLSLYSSSTRQPLHLSRVRCVVTEA